MDRSREALVFLVTIGLVDEIEPIIKVAQCPCDSGHNGSNCSSRALEWGDNVLMLAVAAMAVQYF